MLKSDFVNGWEIVETGRGASAVVDSHGRLAAPVGHLEDVVSLPLRCDVGSPGRFLDPHLGMEQSNIGQVETSSLASRFALETR